MLSNPRRRRSEAASCPPHNSITFLATLDASKLLILPNVKDERRRGWALLHRRKNVKSVPQKRPARTAKITKRMIAAGMLAIDHFTMNATIEPNGILTSVTATVLFRSF